MARITTKFGCGDRVLIDHSNCPTIGIVTAIFIRGRGRAYEVSYASDNGPTNCICEEVELAPQKKHKSMGFNRKNSN